MRKILLLALLFSNAIICFSQKAADSSRLIKELAGYQPKDSNRVKKLLQMTFRRDLFSRDDREQFAREALDISRKIDYQKGEGFALIFLWYTKIQQGDSAASTLFSQAEMITKSVNDPELTGYYHQKLGDNILNTTNHGALDHFLKAEKLLEGTDTYKLLPSCYISIASYYEANGNLASSIDYGLKALNAAEKENLPYFEISALQIIAETYGDLKDYKNALIYIEKAEMKSKPLRNSSLESNIQNTMGNIYRDMGKYSEGIQAYTSSLELAPNKASKTVTKSNLAKLYMKMGNLPLALDYGFSAYKEAIDEKATQLVTWSAGTIAAAYVKKNMPDSAVYFGAQGLSLASETNDLQNLLLNAEALANAYAMKQDFRNAYTYHLQYINYRDSMLNIEVQNRTALLQYNSDLSKKQAQIAQLNQQQKAQKTLLAGSLIVLAFILLTAGLLLRNNRQKHRANKLLQQSYNNVEQLGEIGRKVNSSLDVKQIIGTVYKNVNQLMDAAVFGIGLYKERSQELVFPATFENGEALPMYTNSLQDHNRFGAVCFNAGKEINIGNLGEEFKDHIQEIATPQHGDQPESIIFLPLTAKEKKLGVITVQSFKKNAYSDYHLYMLRNIANYASIAIDNAESYETLNETLGQLKETQKQLIQSEKMASLGELTAGIAHEIQNPLNFVNNFSEVNTELIEELQKEIMNDDKEEVISIAKSIKENEQKISFHGKRADAIVKGMLQHSRASSGKKEHTDINALADEYLRLSYHGLRAKDKSFNATMENNFDEHIGLINIVPQDIGRVLLNLFTNAFYSVTQKRKQQGDGYKPTVSVTTKRLNDKPDNYRVEIRVKDNGNGIPQTVLEKIYQPFFTTKPTGEGTGLGLSMSYDIITKGHGGNIQVETNEGKGAEFIITLPIT